MKYINTDTHACVAITMKGFSFSLGSKNPSSSSNKRTIPRPNTHNAETKELITEFDSSKPLLSSQSKTLIIPPQPNSWRPTKKMKNLDAPIESEGDSKGALEFETVVDPGQARPGSEPEVSYGLNLRKSGNDDVGSVENSEFVSIDRVMVKNLKEDLENLPDDMGFDEFDGCPVEGFAAAVLKGYGWTQGRGIGKNTKEDVKVVEYERRVGKEGFGFVADAPVMSSNGKDTEKRKEREGGGLVAKDVRIVRGREMGLKGRVLEVSGGGDYVVLSVVENGSEVEVRVRGSDVAELGSVEGERCLRKLRELKIGEEKKDRKIRRSDEREKNVGIKIEERRRDDKNRRGDEREEKPVRKEKEKVRWLTSNIKVRIISKKLKGGKLYLRKGKVVDVVGPSTCDISMDDSRELIQGVDQELLETALPRTGGPILVLYGKYKGVYGSLLQKHMEKETAVVEDADTRKPLHVLLEQIAEYTGDPSEIGY
ncbi:protein MOS2 [Daucus carota subsp. sativus]|nr:PREDICTED: protein MOS2-like [Daucus carota subsp. sativus]XP_017252110.1 PREDICTED: protein MOS2-like [Daucus carota subsp. sativus]